MTTDYSPFTIRAPASTANFGSAFDAVGMALDLWLEVRVEPRAENAIIMQGEGADQLADAADQNLIIRAAALGASRLGVELPTLRVTAQNGIPLARGLGSSAAAIATGLLIANTPGRRRPRNRRYVGGRHAVGRTSGQCSAGPDGRHMCRRHFRGRATCWRGSLSSRTI